MVCSTRSQGVADAFGSLKRASSSAAGIAVVIAHLLRHQYGTPGSFRIMRELATRCDRRHRKRRRPRPRVGSGSPAPWPGSGTEFGLDQRQVLSVMDYLAPHDTSAGYTKWRLPGPQGA